jgi:hypothetical protein
MKTICRECRANGLYALCRKKACRKQFFTSEDAAKVKVRGKNSFEKIVSGEEKHNRATKVINKQTTLLQQICRFISFLWN